MHGREKSAGRTKVTKDLENQSMQQQGNIFEKKTLQVECFMIYDVN